MAIHVGTKPGSGTGIKGMVSMGWGVDFGAGGFGS